VFSGGGHYCLRVVAIFLVDVLVYKRRVVELSTIDSNLTMRMIVDPPQLYAFSGSGWLWVQRAPTGIGCCDMPPGDHPCCLLMVAMGSHVTGNCSVVPLVLDIVGLV
jgi:hypothetical protein